MFLEAGSIEGIDKRYLKGTVPFLQKMMQHPDRDEFWQKRALLPHLKNVSFSSKTSAFYQAEIELPFFEKYLKDKDFPAPAEATVFETGSNVWRIFDHWPPRRTEMKELFLHNQGRLDWIVPQDEVRTESEESRDEFTSDLDKPVPYTETITPKMTVEYMVDDQRSASRRPDVLTYQTEHLLREAQRFPEGDASSLQIVKSPDQCEAGSIASQKFAVTACELALLPFRVGPFMASGYRWSRH